MSERLKKYREKRTPGTTPEPFGEAGLSRPRLYCIQKHAARRLHYDLRLELGGTLLSWAVPAGPSFDPGEKRLAVHVEDHPVEYADFEGLIPKGNYGAGAVIVWDRGSWVPLEDPVLGMEKGKLLFELRGYKLRGVWNLVRTRRGGQPTQDWLLIKKPDEWATPGNDEPIAAESILSGRTVEAVAGGQSVVGELADAADAAGARSALVRAATTELMLAEQRDRPFSGPDWLFELKYDGYRLLCGKEEGTPILRYRRGGMAAALFPDLARAVATLPCSELLLDAEVCVLDPRGRPTFQLLQQRSQLTRAGDIERAAAQLPATLFVFDLLGLEGRDLRALPLVERKSLLERLLPRLGPLRYVDHIEERGEDMYAEVERMGLEGIVAKRKNSPYRPGRSSDWVKVRVQRTADLVVVGYSAPEGSRLGVGALHLAAWRAQNGAKNNAKKNDGGLVYAGRVGTGFTDKQLVALRTQLEPKRRATPPCAGPVPTGAKHTWVEPELICEVRYTEWTREGLLRQPAFLRFRTDKAISECEGPPAMAEASAAPASQSHEPPPPPKLEPERVLRIVNRDKVFWPDEGYTKGDLLDFYHDISPWLLPYLRDRPLVLTRYPDGIAGKNFFQKDAPSFVPDWVRTIRIYSEQSDRDIDYFVCDDLDMLMYVINSASIPLHAWSSRVATLTQPDYSIVDLDPKTAPFEHVVRIARLIRELCEEAELPSYIKTSGQKGLHVLLPLGGKCTYEQSRQLAELIARIVVDRLPDIATIARAIPARGGKVYVDYGQNGHGRTIVSPFSVRPIAGAPVSTPLEWREVGPKLDPARFTIRTVVKRMQKRGDDPLRGVLTGAPDLVGALTRLGEKLRADPPKPPKVQVSPKGRGRS
jgi:bifunctional non-homologous end joining protein LigD